LLVVYSIKPANRYNIDKAGIIEGIGTNSLVVRRLGKKVIQWKTPRLKAWTLFIKYISATGLALPLLVIFKGKTV